MKNLLTILTLLFAISLTACHKTDKKTQASDPVPETITQQEVSRIALLEAKQLLTNAKNNNLDISSITKTYEKAQNLYDNGEYKKAQITAVNVRHQVEKLR